MSTIRWEEELSFMDIHLDRMSVTAIRLSYRVVISLNSLTFAK